MGIHCFINRLRPFNRGTVESVGIKAAFTEVHIVLCVPLAWEQKISSNDKAERNLIH